MPIGPNSLLRTDSVFWTFSYSSGGHVQYMRAGAVSLHNVDIRKYVQHIDPQHRIFLHARKPTKQENCREIISTVTGLVNGLIFHTENFVDLSEIEF